MCVCKMKWKISWWFKDGLDGIKRGQDIVEASEDFDDIDAEKLLNNEMEPSIYHKVILKNFNDNNSATLPQNWGVLRVVPIKEVKRNNKC